MSSPTTSRGRRPLTRLLLAVLGALAALLAYAYAVEPRWLRIRRLAAPLHTWNPSLDGVRVLHISDLHIGHSTRRTAAFLRRASRIDADLTVITGDFLAGPSGIDHARSVLREITASRTVVGVLGNHDHGYHTPKLPTDGRWRRRHHFDSRAVMGLLGDAGLIMLANSSVALPVGRGTLHVVGLDDRFSGADDIDAALRGIEDMSSVLMLCHSPDILDQASRRGVPLVLSGHTHGGQVRFGPWLTPTTGTQHPLPRPSGLIERAHTFMHVSPGLATSVVPLRFFARPEVTVLELRAPNPRGAGGSEAR